MCAQLQGSWCAWGLRCVWGGAMHVQACSAFMRAGVCVCALVLQAPSAWSWPAFRRRKQEGSTCCTQPCTHHQAAHAWIMDSHCRRTPMRAGKPAAFASEGVPAPRAAAAAAAAAAAGTAATQARSSTSACVHAAQQQARAAAGRCRCRATRGRSSTAPCMCRVGGGCRRCWWAAAWREEGRSALALPLPATTTGRV